MRYLTLAVFVLTASVTAQVEHAPTVAQCQADERLWFSKLTDESDSSLPGFEVLHLWAEELSKCQKIDPDPDAEYRDTEAIIHIEQETRLLHFVDRHNLIKQFMEEDAAGKR